MVVFVAGVHGVGKTYLCDRFSAQTGIMHSSASSLIKRERQSASWESNKLVSDIDANQVALTKAVNRLTEKNTNLLLDGHFVLKDQNGLLIEVDESIFKELSLSAIVLIEAPTEIVRSRLLSRDSNSLAGDISNFQNTEKTRATYISKILNVPLFVLNQPSEQIFQATINHLLKVN
ncbi:ATP-binding protein [Pseudomonas chlororaphis]|uniref:Adenylate kinase n=1 Tax=Pseudomonas chlororaphis TaxID=587753 RepID=A0A1Q8ES77_9PSED|nr:ATP-binding protein [Pseudomonas chlororaphis]OLF54642.1 hypothetical protein BTN82_11630 [Pseudomonas chlororaphis]